MQGILNDLLDLLHLFTNSMHAYLEQKKGPNVVND